MEVSRSMQTKGETIVGADARKYDLTWRGPKAKVYKKTADLLELKTGDRILDVGCGTGTILSNLASKYGASVSLTGIDPSGDMLAIAKTKLQESEQLQLVVGVGEKLPFPNQSLNKVVSSFAFHHLPTEIKLATLSEIRRVLADNGSFLLVDWGKPVGLLGKIIGFFIRKHSHSASQLEKEIEDLGIQAGFGSFQTVSIQIGIIHYTKYYPKSI